MVKKVKEKFKENGFKTDNPRNIWSFFYNLIVFRTKEFLMVIFSVTLCVVILSTKISCNRGGIQVEKKDINPIPYSPQKRR